MLNESVKRIFLTTKKILSSVFLIACLVAVAQASYYVSLPETNELTTYDGVRHIIVNLFISCLFLYMLVRAQTIHNTFLRKKCVASLSSIDRVKLIFKSFDFWFDCIGFLFVLCAFDISKTFTVLSELFGNENETGMKLEVICIVLPIIMLLDFIARYMAIGCWFRKGSESGIYIQTPSLGNDPMAKNSAKLIPTAPEIHAMRFLSRTYSVNSSVSPILERSEEYKIDESLFTKKAKFKTFLFVFLPTVLMVVLSNILYSAVKVLGWILVELVVMWQTWAIIGALIGIVFLSRIIRAWLSRYEFLRRLKNVCKNNKYKLSKIYNPYKSLFSLHNGKNFSVAVNGKIYSCKFISCSKPATPLFLDKDGSATFLHGITFAGVNWFQSTKKFEYAYESDSTKILIINPSNKFTYAINDGIVSELDNGDRIGEHLVYTGNSFINAIDRDCIGKREV